MTAKLDEESLKILIDYFTLLAEIESETNE